MGWKDLKPSLLLGVRRVCEMQPNGVHNARNPIDATELNESVDSVAKPTSLLYSIDVANLLRQNKLPKR
jgi:hypothetical protein